MTALTTPTTPQPLRYGTLATLALLRDRRRYPQLMADAVARAEGLALLRVGPVRIAVLADPAAAWALLTAPGGTSKGRGADPARPLLGLSVVTAEGAEHRRRRRLVQPAFTADALRGYPPQILQVVRRHADSWHDGRRLDLADDMAALTFEVVGRTLLGRRDGNPNGPDLLAAMGEALALYPKLMRPGGTALARLPSPTRAALRRVTARLDAELAPLLAADSPEAQGDGVLARLLAARDEDGAPLSPSDVRNELLTLVLAGHETTAVALTWAWRELAASPSARDRLAAELATPAAAEAIDAGAWHRLSVTRAVLAETLRLHPPVFVTSRELTEPMELAGVRLPARTMVLVSPYALHRDPRRWPEPHAFAPERWLDAAGRYDEGAPGQPRGGYLPFGAGYRICVGAGLATMEATLALAVLAGRFDVVPDPGAGLEHDPGFTLRVRGGLPATVRRRG